MGNAANINVRENKVERELRISGGGEGVSNVTYYRSRKMVGLDVICGECALYNPRAKFPTM